MRRKRRSVEEAYDEGWEGVSQADPSFSSAPGRFPRRWVFWAAFLLAGALLGVFLLLFLKPFVNSGAAPHLVEPLQAEATPVVVESLPIAPSSPVSSPSPGPESRAVKEAEPAEPVFAVAPPRASARDPFAYAPSRSVSAARSLPVPPPVPLLPMEVPPPPPSVELLGVALGARPSAALRLGGEVMVLSPGERVPLGEGGSGGSLVLLAVTSKGAEVLLGGRRMLLSLGGER